MAVKRVILQHFSMRYDYMKERPNIYQPSQNGVDPNFDFSSFKKNRSTTSKSLLAGGPASRNRSTYGRSSTLSTRQSINKYGSANGKVLGTGIMVGANSGPGGGSASRSGSSVFNTTTAGSRSGGFTILNVHDEDDDDDVLENFGRLDECVAEENEDSATVANDRRSYCNGNDDGGGKNEGDEASEKGYHIYWRDLDDYDYDNDGDADDDNEEDDEEEDTYHQNENSSILPSEPDTHLFEGTRVYKSSWIIDSDDEYNPDYDENEKSSNYNYEHDDDDDNKDQVDFNKTTPATTTLMRPSATNTDLKEEINSQNYNTEDDIADTNDVYYTENAEVKANAKDEAEKQRTAYGILESISDLKAMLPEENNETGKYHTIDEINKNFNNLRDEVKDKIFKRILTDKQESDNKADGKVGLEEAVKEQHDAVPVKNVPFIMDKQIKSPPQENINDRDDAGKAERQGINDKLYTAPQASILKTSNKQQLQQQQNSDQQTVASKSPISQGRTVCFATEGDEDYEVDDDDDNEGNDLEKQDVFKKPFLYNNYSNRQRQYSKYQQQQQQDIHKRYISNNLKQQQQQQQQPIENWRQRNNTNQEKQHVAKNNLKNFKNLDNQSYRKYRPNHGTNFYGNQHRNYLGSFSHGGAQQQQKQAQQQPVSPPRSNPYVLPDYYHQNNGNGNSNRHNSGGSSGGTPPSDNEGHGFNKAPVGSNEIRNWRNDCIYSSVRNCNSLQHRKSPTQQVQQQRKCFSQQPQMQPLYRVNPQRIGSGRFLANGSAATNNIDVVNVAAVPFSFGLSPPSESLLLQRRLQRLNNASSLVENSEMVKLLKNSNEYCPKQQATASG